MTKPAATTGNRKTLLIRFRKWHSWGGLLLSLLILLVAATGILLNHKDFFFHGGKKKATGLLRSTTDLDSVPVSFEHAMHVARRHYGDVPLDKIELKDENGWLVYKVSQGHGEEVRVDARSGQLFSKYRTRPAAGQQTAPDWEKIVNDLHTGKILGTIGKLTIDAVSGAIVALTVTGVYLWGVPALRKRQNRRDHRRHPQGGGGDVWGQAGIRGRLGSGRD